MNSHVKPLCIDGYCGLGGWAEGFLAEGYQVIGFDIERHDYGTGGYPGELVIQDVLTLHGSQFKDADCLVFSPPCQEYSYMAMPWKRAKQIARALRRQGDFPEGYTGSRTISELTALFNACFRLQREAVEAAGHHIPMVVENVKGAQPWVGRAKANFGSFYCWGDIAMVGNRIVMPQPEFAAESTRAYCHRMKSRIPATGDRFDQRVASTPEEAHALHYRLPVDCGRKVPMNFHEHEKTGLPGRSFQSAAVECSGVKQEGLSGPAGFDRGAAHLSSRSSARKAASAQIAKIPFELSSWVARCYRPVEVAA